MFRLEGQRTFLVPFEERHLRDEEYFGWLRDYEVVKTINRLEYVRPVSFAEVKEYCESVCRSRSDVFLAIYSMGEERFIGTIRASRLDLVNRTADVGILIGNRAYWGRGIATDALTVLCRYLFERLGLRKLTAGLMKINPAMLRVFEKLGFRVEGVFRKQDYFEGDYVDHVYLGCFREEFVPPGK
jgi:RimJ/RimL family protein N-acetyltransferase